MITSTGHVTSADGTSIGYTRSGDGPPLVLVHGTSVDHTRWAPALTELEPHVTVYALDRRGRGLSGDASTYDIEREYEDVAAVVDAVGGPVDLLGHSYGALVALEAALLTNNVRRLVLYEPGFRTDEPLYPDGLREHLEDMLARGERDEMIATFLRDVVDIPADDVAAMREAPTWEMRRAVAHTIPREFADGDYILDPARFRSLTIPVLLLTGSDSPRELRAPTDALHAALPSSKLQVLQGQSHIAMITAPDLFARAVIDFLA